MASPKIIPKKSTIAKVPSPNDLVSGEVAVNYADQQWYGKHPSTGAVVEIGAPFLHSHDELYSLDKSKHLELQNNGGLVLTAGANATTLTPTKSGPMLVGSTSDSIPVHVIRCLTQSEYDALGTYDANTLYFIK